MITRNTLTLLMNIATCMWDSANTCIGANLWYYRQDLDGFAMMIRIESGERWKNGMALLTDVVSVKTSFVKGVGFQSTQASPATTCLFPGKTPHEMVINPLITIIQKDTEVLEMFNKIFPVIEQPENRRLRECFEKSFNTFSKDADEIKELKSKLELVAGAGSGILQIDHQLSEKYKSYEIR